MTEPSQDQRQCGRPARVCEWGGLPHGYVDFCCIDWGGMGGGGEREEALMNHRNSLLHEMPSRSPAASGSNLGRMRSVYFSKRGASYDSRASDATC